MRNYLRRRRLSSLGLTAIGMKVAQVTVIVADTYSGIMVSVRFQAGRMMSVGG